MVSPELLVSPELSRGIGRVLCSVFLRTIPGVRGIILACDQKSV